MFHNRGAQFGFLKCYRENQVDDESGQVGNGKAKKQEINTMKIHNKDDA